ncbi:MAG: ABC transporter substrate-binding protein [Acidobacteriota bacterium]
MKERLGRPGWRCAVGLAVLGLLSVLLPACRETPPGSPLAAADPGPAPRREPVTGVPGGRLRYALVGDPETFNLTAATDNRSRLLAGLLTATLLEFDPVTQEVVPGLAEEYEILEPGKRIRVRLRPGVKYSDGQPFQTEDVLFSLDCLYSPSSQNVLRDALQWGEGRLQASVVAERTLEILAPQPVPNLPYLLSTIPLLPRHRLQAYADRIEQAWDVATAPEEIVGLGPFRLREHVPGRHTILERNPYYWRVDEAGRPLPYLDEIEVVYVEDPNSRVLLLDQGEIDFLDQGLRPEDLTFLRTRSHLVVEDFGPSNHVLLLWFNLNFPAAGRNDGYDWFRRREFRRAISAAVDREALVQNVFGGYATPARSLIPPANRRWHDPAQSCPAYDPEAARRILEQAGFRRREAPGGAVCLDPAGRPVRFQLLSRPEDQYARTGAVIVEDLKRLGIAVEFQQEEFRAVVRRILSGADYDAALMALEVPLEPLDMANVLRTGGQMHLWRTTAGDPFPWELEIDRLMDELAGNVEPAVRQRLFSRLQEILAEECPVIPLVHRNFVVVRRKGVAGLETGTVFPYAWARPWRIFLAER